jgi:hypothetical protein
VAERSSTEVVAILSVDESCGIYPELSSEGNNQADPAAQPISAAANSEEPLH